MKAGKQQHTQVFKPEYICGVYFNNFNYEVEQDANCEDHCFITN